MGLELETPLLPMRASLARLWEVILGCEYFSIAQFGHQHISCIWFLACAAKEIFKGWLSCICIDLLDSIRFDPHFDHDDSLFPICFDPACRPAQPEIRMHRAAHRDGLGLQCEIEFRELPMCVGHDQDGQPIVEIVSWPFVLPKTIVPGEKRYEFWMRCPR